MEPNNPTQETTPEQYPQQPVTEQPIKQKGVLLPVIGGVFLIVVVGAGAYYLGITKSSTQPVTKDATPTSSLQPSPTISTISPTATQPSTDQTANWKMYTSSSEFTFKYPSDWTITPDTYKYNYISLRSPDYSVNTEGIETLDKGVELMIYTETTTETSIDKKFEQDKFAGQIANSKTYTTVDGQRAIQYDYSYESTQATDTIFIKNGMHYLIKLRYADSNTKSKYWSTYLGILGSFKGL